MNCNHPKPVMKTPKRGTIVPHPHPWHVKAHGNGLAHILDAHGMICVRMIPETTATMVVGRVNGLHRSANMANTESRLTREAIDAVWEELNRQMGRARALLKKAGITVH